MRPDKSLRVRSNAQQRLTDAGRRPARGTCKTTPVRGKKRCRMHGGAAGSGAPKGNQNALKHGLFTREAIAARIDTARMIREMKAAMQFDDEWKKSNLVLE